MASMLFGIELHVTRVRMQRRQGEVARLAGMDASTLAAIEGGRRKAPSCETVEKLLFALNVNERLCKKLRSLAVIDRMLDEVDEQYANDPIISRLSNLLLQVAEYNDGEWESLDCALAVLTRPKEE